MGKLEAESSLAEEGVYLLVVTLYSEES